MKLYKFRALGDCRDIERVKDIVENGFYCSNFLDFNDMNEGVYQNNSENAHISLDGKLDYKICSFSGTKALNSELMWGHYANSGMGVAIEIDIYDSADNIKQVNYNDVNRGLNSMEEILTNKSKVWEYEDEYDTALKKGL